MICFKPVSLWERGRLGCEYCQVSRQINVPGKIYNLLSDICLGNVSNSKVNFLTIDIATNKYIGRILLCNLSLDHSNHSSPRSIFKGSAPFPINAYVIVIGEVECFGHLLDHVILNPWQCSSLRTFHCKWIMIFYLHKLYLGYQQACHLSTTLALCTAECILAWQCLACNLPSSSYVATAMSSGFSHFV